MDIQYYKDAKHNYLILEAEINEENIFQYKMLENNRIDGLLPFSLRNMDESNYLYYEIDSKQSIKNRYDRKKMPYEKLLRLLSDLVQAAKDVDDYLLDPSHLVLLPEAIFEDFSTGKFYFIYDPLREKNVDQDFFEELMAYVDLEDERCSKKIFDLLDTICDERGLDFCILEKSLKSETRIPSIEEVPIKRVSDDISANHNENRERIEKLYDEFDDDEDADEDDDPAVVHKKIKIRLPIGINFVMAALFAIIAGVLWYLRYAYILTYEENILDIAVFIISVMMSLTCFIIQLKKNNLVFGRKKKDAADDKDQITESVDSKNEEKADITVTLDEDDEENEETVLLGFDFGTKTHKLYADEESQHANIGLQKLPVVIGKLSSCADAVIKDKSVSRMHARIFRPDQDKDQLWIQDLNSTNGTYVNGRKLMPNEKTMLFENDEVAFGKCVFAYR